MTKPFIITIVGAESSGKTTLASILAGRMGCPWVPEYARAYLSALNRPYGQEDLVEIAIGQMALMRSVLSKAPHLAPESIHPVYALEPDRPTLIFKRLEFGNVPRPVVIADGGVLTIRMWSKIKFGGVTPWLEEACQEDETSMYILCRPLSAWEPDPLREAPGLLDRSWIYNQYLRTLTIMQ